MLLADATLDWPHLAQLGIESLRYGLLIALIALGYTMVYGIVELINFAHGDLFMLGSCLSLSIVSLGQAREWPPALSVGLALVAAPLFCGLLNLGVDRAV